MNNDIAALLAALQAASNQPATNSGSWSWSPKVEGQTSQQGPLQLGAPLSPEEKQRLGIDPSDPNVWGRTQGGGLVHTLIGRIPPGMSGGNLRDAVTGGFNAPAGNMIPRANKNGLTRVSPGMYRNQQGKIVKKAQG